MQVTLGTYSCLTSHAYCEVSLGAWSMPVRRAQYAQLLLLLTTLFFIVRFQAWAVFELWGIRTAWDALKRVVAGIYQHYHATIGMRGEVDVTSRVTRDFNRLKLESVLYFGDTLSAFVQLLVQGYLVMLAGWPFAGVTVLALIALTRLQGLSGQLIHLLSVQLSETNSQVISRTSDTLRNGELIRQYLAPVYVKERALKAAVQHARLEMWGRDVVYLSRFYVDVIAGCFVTCGVLAMLLMRDTRHLNTVELGVMLALLLRTRFIFDWFFTALRSIGELGGPFERIYQLLEVAPSSSTNHHLATPGITFRNYTANYINHHAPVLCDLNLTIAPRAKVAVIGPSGSGKSSFLLALCGLLEHQSGTLEVGDKPQSFPAGDPQILFIPQFFPVFAGSLKSQLDPMGTHSEDTVTATLRQLNLPYSAQSVVTTPASLPASHRQLLSWVFLRINAPRCSLLLLDEPISTLDHNMEQHLVQSLMTYHDKTVVMVSHKLGSLNEFDCILHFENGQLHDHHSARNG